MKNWACVIPIVSRVMIRERGNLLEFSEND